MARQSNELFRSFLTRAVDALGEIKDTVVRSSQIGKIKLDATAIRRERDFHLQRLGARIFEAVEAGALTLPGDLDLEPILARIREAEDGLAQQEAELAAVEAEAAMQREHARRAAEAAREAQAALAEDKYDELAGEGFPAPVANGDAAAVEEGPREKKAGG